MNSQNHNLLTFSFLKNAHYIYKYSCAFFNSLKVKILHFCFAPNCSMSVEKGFEISLTPANLDQIISSYQASREFKGLSLVVQPKVIQFFNNLRDYLISRPTLNRDGRPIDVGEIASSPLAKELNSIGDASAFFKKLNQKVREKQIQKSGEAKVCFSKHGGDGEPPFPAIWGGVLILSGALLCIIPTPVTKKLGVATIVYGVEELGRGLSQQNEINKEKQCGSSD